MYIVMYEYCELNETIIRFRDPMGMEKKVRGLGEKVREAGIYVSIMWGSRVFVFNYRSLN